MWQYEVVAETDSVKKLFLRDRGGRLSFRAVVELWTENPDFNDWFSQTLLRESRVAVRWETPAVTLDSVEREFECVLVEDPSLARSADARPFENQFSTAEKDAVISFSNLGRNAIMVVPTPGDSVTDYCHLCSFLGSATDAQLRALWRVVGLQMKARMNATPVWLNTAGGGVAWLHVRLDDTPKYYTYRSYKNPPTNASPS